MSKTLNMPNTLNRPDAKDGARGQTQAAVHISFAVCMLAFVIVYARNYLSLIDFWASSRLYQYALLVFPVSAFLVWARRDWLVRTTARPRAAALWALSIIGLLWLLGAVAQINLAMQIAVIVVWPVMVYLFYGPQVARILGFALGYLLLAIPFRHFAMEYMVVPLQTVTAHLAVFALGFTSVPVFMTGHYISTPVTTWHVAKACSGISFFLATSAFGFLYAYLFFNSLRRRLAFIVFALVVPIIANALRVFFTILIGEHFGLEYATGTDHLIFGWQFFGTVLVLLFFCGWPWHEPLPALPKADADMPESGSKRMRWIFPLALILIVLPAAWYGGTGWLANSYAVSAPGKLPAQLAGQSRLLDGHGNAATTIAAGTEVRLVRRYGNRRQPIRVEYMGSHVGHDAADFVRFSTQLYDTNEWRVENGPPVIQRQPDGMQFAVLKLTAVGDSKHRQLLLYAYRTGPHWTASAVQFKLRKTLNRLLGRPAPIGIMVVSCAGMDSWSRLEDVANAAAQSILETQS